MELMLPPVPPLDGPGSLLAEQATTVNTEPTKGARYRCIEDDFLADE
jgi:hypothetical protein